MRIHGFSRFAGGGFLGSPFGRICLALQWRRALRFPNAVAAIAIRLPNPQN